MAVTRRIHGGFYGAFIALMRPNQSKQRIHRVLHDGFMRLHGDAAEPFDYISWRFHDGCISDQRLALVPEAKTTIVGGGSDVCFRR